MVRQRTTLRRLFRYAIPYRGRLAWAVVGMIVYAVGSAGLAWLIKPIFDNVLPKQQEVALIAWGIVGVYLLKGIGSYVSSYLMADVGQRVVMDLRNDLYRHILGQSAGFFAHGATGRLLLDRVRVGEQQPRRDGFNKGDGCGFSDGSQRRKVQSL